MNLRLKPIFLSFVLSLLILSAGWLLYQQYAVRQPLERWLLAQEVTIDHLRVQPRQVALVVDAASLTSIAEFHQELLARIPRSHRLALELRDNPSQQMLQLWEESHFVFLQALRRDEFALIPREIERLNAVLPHAQAFLRRDHVYVDWRDENGHHLIRILPLHPGEGRSL